MKKVLFFSLSKENIASSRTRVFQYIPYLEEQNIYCKVIVHNPYYANRSNNLIIKGLQGLHKSLRALQFTLTSFFFKNIYIQKIYVPRWLLYLLRVLKKNILFDFDDAIYVNEQCDNIAAKKLARLRYTLRFANWTIVENQTNVQFAKSCGSKNTLLITGPIECRRYMPFERETCSEDIIIGWIGGPSTTKYLDIVRKPLQQIVEKYPHVKLLLIGANDLSIEGVNVETHPWALDTEVELLKRFDIGIMPLYDDIWCAGKGGYKLLQYMAMGIPSVVSPVGINTDIVNSSKFGLLAATESDWLICFEKLIIDAALRAEMGRDARINALHLFSYQKYAKDLAACFI